MMSTAYAPGQRISSDDVAQAISLNATAADRISPGSLVRFRCMVQDAQDPEIYLDTYVIEDSTGNRTICSNGFRECVSVPENVKVDYNAPENVMKTRQTYYCIPIPGEADWVKQEDIAKVPVNSAQQGAAGGIKRSLEEDDDVEMELIQTEHVPIKRQKDGNTGIENDSKKGAAGFDMNFPIPGQSGPAAMVKFYGESNECPKINQMIDIFGIYDINPEHSMADFSDDPFGRAEELAAQHPPSSLIPRLHCVEYRILDHNNPRLPAQVAQQIREEAKRGAPAVREKVLEAIATALGCGRLTSEFILLHLLSHVHTRKDDNTLVLGKLALNVFGVSAQHYEGISFFNAFLDSVLTCHHAQSMNLKYLENVRMNPRKNERTGRLDSGLLQLVPGTSLVLDECSMNEGKLSEKGIKNLKALAQLMRHQTVEFEFEYSPLNFPVDIGVLIFSEGKSMLPADVQVPFVTGANSPVQLNLDAEDLNQFRNYFTLSKSSEYSIGEDVQKIIEDDFVRMRQESPQDTKGETLHCLLVLARLLCQSLCQSVLTEEVWKKAIEMEVTRREAVAAVAPVEKNKPPSTLQSIPEVV